MYVLTFLFIFVKHISVIHIFMYTVYMMDYMMDDDTLLL